MSTIHQWIQEDFKPMVIGARMKRAEKLRNSNASEILIESVESSAAYLKENELSYTDKDHLGGCTIRKVEQKKGNDGVIYFQFTTAKGIINFFPSAKFGPFLSKNIDKENSDGKN